MGRKRKEVVQQESTTTVFRPEATPQMSVASTDSGDVGYDNKGKVTTNPKEMVAEKVGNQYWIMFIGPDLYNPKEHSLKSTSTFNKSRRVNESCFNDYLDFLKTGSQIAYNRADKKAILAN